MVRISTRFDLQIQQSEAKPPKTSQVSQYAQKLFTTDFRKAFDQIDPQGPVYGTVQASCTACSFRIQQSDCDPTKFTLVKKATSKEGENAEKSFSFEVARDAGRLCLKRTDASVSFCSLGAFFTYFLFLEIFEKPKQVQMPQQVPQMDAPHGSLLERLRTTEILDYAMWE